MHQLLDIFKFSDYCTDKNEGIYITERLEKPTEMPDNTLDLNPNYYKSCSLPVLSVGFRRKLPY
ncbi:hypothetical protein TREVI0001_0587 [Treponema vincentii ATCC 35580]|uniref:Uncharacterized protein n=1 Tax=Treponema vincentii ATCC 35580 TaxID=596324 RepID=C8PMH3_9SPIR|nr:hypothetical protein TREVI0001_0587 [Treponema vincentii ATCC 35580]